jgi:hypothetical protein
MVKKVLIVILTFLGSIATGQDIEVGLNIGYGGYNMSDLKAMDEQFATELPFPAEVTDNFPAWWNYGGYLTFGISKVYRTGVRLQYFSTGGKVSSRDYSGEYEAVNTINAFSPGFLNTFTIYRKKGFELIINGIAGLNFSKLKISERLQVTDSSSTSEVTYHSTSFYVEPQFGFTYSFLYFKAGLTAGYMLDFESKLHTGDGYTTTKSNWSGYRIAMTFAFSMANLEKEKSKDAKIWE